MTTDEIQRSQTATRCKCNLRPGMTRAELRTLGGGCTMPGYCCPTLDTYRRRTPAAGTDEFGWSPAGTQVRRNA